MDTNPLPTDKLPTDVEELKRMLLHTRDELATTRQQVIELSSTISAQEQRLEQKERLILELLKALRGKQRERVDPNQLLLFEIGELEQLIEEKREESQPTLRRRKKHGRRLIPEGLPQEVVEYEVPEDQRLCPVDGNPMPRIRWEETKQLDYVPAKMKVIVHRRAVYACPQKHDEATLVTAPKPPQPIEKGLAAAGLLAQVVVSKFGDHLPGYRLEDIFSRHGVEIRRSTIYDWLSGVADLCQPLYQLMKQRVLASQIIHTDDTQVKLIDHSLRSTRLARFWSYLGDADHPYAIYDFTEDRTRAGPEKFLKGFSGYLQADAYGGYDGIYLSSSEDPALEKVDPALEKVDPAQPSADRQIIEVGCWAHCRRYWHKAREQDPTRAHHVLAVISRLYEIERATAGQTSAFRQAQRCEHAAPLLSDLKSWLDEQTFLPKSLSGKAATYLRNQWTALNRYIEHGDLSIDNNQAERAVRPVAIGRKNWLFVGSPIAGGRAATLMSLIASCKNNSVEPWAYLKDILTQLASQPTGETLQSLLPDRWLSANPTHRWNIADRRHEERKPKTP
jgi:transposase